MSAAKNQGKLPMCGHERPVMKNDEWLTPPSILARLGELDLDPCSPIIRPWDTAKKHFNVRDNGLEQDWFGRVWLNPPFGSEAVRWLKKLARHGLYIELKKQTGGRVSPEQRSWLSALEGQGYRAVVCKGAAHAWQVIADYLQVRG